MNELKYYPDQKYQDYLAEMQALFSDPELFASRERQIAEQIHLMEEVEPDEER